MQVTSENTRAVFQNLYGTFPLRGFKIKPKFEVGDQVRISKLRGVFDKKYEQSFTDEVFTVSEVISHFPTVYRLQDFDSENI